MTFITTSKSVSKSFCSRVWNILNGLASCALLWNYTQLDTRAHIWWQVNIGSGNGRHQAIALVNVDANLCHIASRHKAAMSLYKTYDVRYTDHTGLGGFGGHAEYLCQTPSAHVSRHKLKCALPREGDQRMHHRVIVHGQISSIQPCIFPDCWQSFECVSSQDNTHSYAFLESLWTLIMCGSSI